MPTSTPAVPEEPYYRDDRVTLLHSDALDQLRTLPDQSVDAVITDPPYGIEFMGKDWDAPWKTGDRRGIVDADQWGQGRSNPYSRARTRSGRGDAYRVSSAESGQQYQQWCSRWTEEALRLLKPGGHMIAFGGTRTYHRMVCAAEDSGFEIRDSLHWLYGTGFPKSMDVSKAIDKAAGATRVPTGKAKPGHEQFAGRTTTGHLIAGEGHDGWTRPWGSSSDASAYHLATAPATADAARWEGWGTALSPGHEPMVLARKPLSGTVAATVLEHGTGALHVAACRPVGEPAGRWPANVVLSHQPLVDAVGGVVGDGCADGCASGCAVAALGDRSRYFPAFRYEPKPGAAERGGKSGKKGSGHPTVKPLALMRWLVRLVTPPGGLVLDPFAGSGTTLLAARGEGMRAIGIERHEPYAGLSAARLSEPYSVGLFDTAP
ncbi:hypothetical protein AMK23_26185 [Streptomyces sp. CB02130]|uniref:DNA-methyltransferase n=1 Tax=Streptomyces sp. CB02130 TaxID=1703934 RepID=UPI00093A80E2|nr:site-specific DNA-methyltransferase [Streptomyces sp. CB02130]OKJ24327.1 hypothetical protein AMK23_26185 [Streptomyces sp. CB02130]